MGRPAPLAELLLACASAVESTVEDPWAYGWAFDDYRRSGRASLPGRTGPVTLKSDAIDMFEQIVQRLQREPEIRRRWDPTSFWSTVACAIVELSEIAENEGAASVLLRRLREAPPTLVVVVLANVRWSEVPMAIAGGVIGSDGEEFNRAVSGLAQGRQQLDRDDALDWLVKQRGTGQHQTPLVLAALWTDGQQQLAVDEAERWLAAVTDLALLFEPDLAGKELWSLRGAQNRPGVRGTTMHRPAIEQLLATEPDGHLDLASEPYVASPGSDRVRATFWHSASPVPLDKMLQNSQTCALVDGTASSGSETARRLRVAARWHAEAHWSIDTQHAALALGVALDSVVGSQRALGSGEMSQRFAYLEPDVSQRAARVHRYKELFSVRSAVAHGGVSSRATGDFVREFSSEVRWAARRLVDFTATFNTVADGDIDAVFASLALGERTW